MSEPAPDFKRGSVVKILTDTIFDADGLPFSIRHGATGKVISADEDFCQILVRFTNGEYEVFGVPNGRVQQCVNATN